MSARGLGRARARAAVTSLLLAAVVAPGVAGGQTAPRPPSIGYLANEPTPDTSQVLRARLTHLGWAEGRSVTIWYRYAQGKIGIFPAHADELVRLGVDVLVAASPPAIEAARQATRTIPIVAVTTDDPLARGLVTSLEHPGGNVTGVTLAAPGLARRRLELLARLVPRAARVAVLWNPTNPSHSEELRETQAAARELGVQLVPVPLAEDTARRVALGAIQGAHVGGLVVFADTLTVARRAELARFAARTRIPAVYTLPEFVDAGGLLAYGATWRDAFQRAAALVDRILRGAAPAELPVERSARVELHVNLKAARTLGLSVPPALLSRADRVVQ